MGGASQLTFDPHASEDRRGTFEYVHDNTINGTPTKTRMMLLENI